MRARPALLAIVLLGGCVLPAHPPMGETRAAAALRQADADVRAGRARAARAGYAQALEADAHGPTAEAALWGLARLQVDPDSPLCDYHAALAAFDRLLAAYPNGAYAGEARAWRAALRQLGRSEREATRLRTDIDRLRELDQRMEGAE